MNTGLGDATNLAWKLASVLKGHAPSDILDTYEPERIAFAKTLVNTTDRFFTYVSGAGLVGTFVRSIFMPFIWPVAFKIPVISKTVYRRISQIEIEYRQSSLSEGSAGSIHAGDRIPFVPLDDDSDNHGVLNSLRWQAHVYGSSVGSLREILEARGVPLHVFPWTKAAETTGLQQDAIYLLRPDGYVGKACAGTDLASLEGYLTRSCNV